MGWDDDRYALAALVDAQRTNNWMLAMINRDPKKAKPKPPSPFPTPQEVKKIEEPKPGSFAAMVVAAKRAARLKEENAKQRGRRGSKDLGQGIT